MFLRDHRFASLNVSYNMVYCRGIMIYMGETFEIQNFKLAGCLEKVLTSCLKD